MKSSLEKYYFHIEDIQKAYLSELDFINDIRKESKTYNLNKIRLLCSIMEQYHRQEIKFCRHDEKFNFLSDDFVSDFISKVVVIYKHNRCFSREDFIKFYFYNFTEISNAFIDWPTLMNQFKNEYKEVSVFFFEERYHAYLRKNYPGAP